MKKLLIALGVLVLLPALFFGMIGIASELGGEVIVLRTLDAEGAPVETRLWRVEHEGARYLRGGADSGWFVRLQAQPEVEVDDDAGSARYRAVPLPGDAAMRDRLNALMAEKYGFADRLIDLMRDPEAVIPIRLDPIS